MTDASPAGGTLYVVGTPIGNLGDLGERARQTLHQVSLVAAEDTRQSRKLLSHFGISAKLVSCHKHNERECARRIIERLERGEDVAIVTDAGTPALSDPGACLVERVRGAGFAVVPIPGISAITAALSVSGMPADSFLFVGFLPAKKNARLKALEPIASLPYTLVFFESPHRLLEALEDLRDVLGDRRIFMARELTKLHETLFDGTISDLLAHLAESGVRGEVTLVVAGGGSEAGQIDEGRWEASEALLSVLIAGRAMPLREAVDRLVALTGLPKGILYDRALALKKEAGPADEA